MMGSARKKKRLGRRSGSTGESRAAIIKAAKDLFSSRGFRGTTTREIARQAGVDMALVHHFFGTKAQLFSHVIEVPMAAMQVADMLGQKDDDAVGERLARFYLGSLFVENREEITAMLRAALGDPDCRPTLRKLLEDGVVKDAARKLKGPGAKLRAELLGAIVVGLFVCRHMMEMEPLATAPIEDIVARLGPAIDAVLAGAAAPPARRTRARPRTAG
jgi:AcrR family transcriptional regulator